MMVTLSMMKKIISYQLKRDNEITGINQIDFSLSIDSDDEKLFNGDIAYSTSCK